MSAVAGRTPVHVGGLSDEELVKLARAGNEQAFDAIVHRYRGPLVSYCRRWLDPHRAEEVVQHTLMKAYLCVRDDVRPLAMRPWLYRVAHNAALNAVEKKGSDWEQLDENYDGVPQPPQVAEQRARFLQIVGEIDALPARQREALLLNEFEGRCYADIAAQLGTSESGVRGLLRRARRQLRDTAAAVLLPIPVLRELVRSDGGRGLPVDRAGELIGTAGAAGGVSAVGGFAKLAAGVLAAGTIAGGGTAIQQQGDESLRAPDTKEAADVAASESADNPSDERSVLVATAKEAAGPYAVSRIAQTGAQLAAGAGLQSPQGGDGAGGGIQAMESEPRNAAQPVETVESPSLLPVEPLTPVKDDAEEEPAEENQGDETPEDGEANDGDTETSESTDTHSGAKEQPGSNEHAGHAEDAEPNAVPATPELP